MRRLLARAQSQNGFGPSSASADCGEYTASSQRRKPASKRRAFIYEKAPDSAKSGASLAQVCSYASNEHDPLSGHRKVFQSRSDYLNKIQ